MSSERTPEQQRFQALIDSLTTTLKEGNSFEQDISVADFKMFLFESLQSFIGNIGKEQGITITVTQDGLHIDITDNRDFAIQIHGFGQKEAKTVIEGEEFSAKTNPVKVAITAHASNDTRHRDRFLVNQVDIRPSSLESFDLRGSIAPALDDSGLYKMMRGNLLEIVKGKGMYFNYCIIRVTPENSFHLSVGQGPLSYPKP